MKIVIPDDYQDTIYKLEAFKLLAGHEVVRYREPARNFDELVDRLKDAECVVEIRERIHFSRTLIERLPKLRLIALVGGRSRAIDYDAARDHQVLVSRGESGSPEAPAELAVALMLAARRNVVVEAPRMQRGEWPTTLSYRLRGSTLGIFGLGHIGKMVAEAGRGLGMKVLVWGRAASLAAASEAGYEAATSQAALFERSDVLQLLVRLTQETRGIVTRADLLRMNPTALFVNVARAALIEPGALVAALEAGRPGFAAVDVYDQEPVIGGDHPLLKMPNVLCTPHLGWAEWDTFELYFRECFEQIVAYAEGRPLRLAKEATGTGSRGRRSPCIDHCGTVQMKSLFLAAAALLALAGPALAQSGNPYNGAMHYAPDQGPQMRYMDFDDSTVLDRAPYAGSDAYSDQLSNHRVYFNHGPGMYTDR